MQIDLMVGLIFGIFVTALGSILIFFLYIKFFTGKTISYRIMEKIGNRYFILKKGKVKLKKTEFKWEDFAYKINPNKSIEDKKRFSIEKILYYEKNNANPLSFLESKFKIDSQIFKDYSESHDYQDLMRDSAQEKMYLFLIIGLIFALVIVIVYSQYNSAQLNDKILNLMKNITQPNPTMIQR